MEMMTTTSPFRKILEKINYFLHVEPYSFIFHTCYWSFILLFVFPAAGWCLVIATLFRSFKYFVLNIREKKINPKDQSRELAVYITGCDSGFGKDLAFALASRGFVVFPGCLTEDGMKQYEANDNIVPLKVDVTKDDDTVNAASAVSKWLKEPNAKLPRKLHAVVNNAGIAICGLVDWVEMSSYQKVMDINFYGTVRTIKAFLPILKEQAFDRSHPEARIVNMISMAGLVANAGISTYYGSKFAQESLSHCLRMELSTLGIDVVNVNPSVHETPLNRGLGVVVDGVWDRLNPKLKEEYGQEFYLHFKRFISEEHLKVMWKAKNVEDKLVECVEIINPAPQVIIGSNALFQSMVFRMLPTSIRVKILEKATPLPKAEASKTKI